MTKKIFFLCVSIGLSGYIFCGDFSIGRHIITKKKVWSLQESLFYLQFDRGSMTEMTSSVGYGLTQTTGFQMNIPVVVHEKHDHRRFKGLEDISMLGQWQFYQTPTTVAVVIAGIELPTHTFKRDPLEIAAPIAYSNDLIFIHSSEQWFCQGEFEIFTTPKHDHLEQVHIGTFFLGAGPKIHYKGASIFTLFSVRGFERTKSDHIIFLGPQFAYIKGNLTIGGAFEWPIAQEVAPGALRVDWILAFLVQLDF